MKLKQLLATALLFCSAGAWAQTDVTSTYLTNADFSQGTPIGSNLKGYGKDGTPYGFQSVDGWTSEVTSGDNNTAAYPNSGMGSAVFAYGSSYQLQGNNKAAPATNPNGEASGNCLGFFAVWGCGGYYYQNVTFPAGKYTITVPMYSQSGTQANTTYTGFFPTSGTNRTVAVNPTVGQWVNQTVTFTLTAETAGQIRVGYQSTGSGSGANPHLFIDCVKIEYTAAVVKDVLQNAITAANSANAVLGTLNDAIATAQAVYDNANATQEQVNTAAATLNAAVELAMSAAGDVTGIFLTNPGFESCTVTTTNAAAGDKAAPIDIAGDWTQVSSAAWSSSAVVEYGGSGQVNGVSAPSTDNAGNSGKALGVSVGWGGLVTYQSAAVVLPAGVYTLKVNAYNAHTATQFASKFGFVPTSGTSTLSSKASFTASTWETDQVTFTLNEATEGKIQVGGQGVSGGSGSNAKVFFDNITIGYQSFLAGAKQAWDDAVADAEAAKANTDYANVTGSELTALNAELAKAEPTTVAGYNEATSALETATNTFVSAATSYNALAEVNNMITAAGTLQYADASKKPSVDATATSASDADTKTASQYAALRAYYESNTLAEGVAGAVNMNSSITNAANPSNTNGWTVNNTVGNSNMRTMSNEPWTNSDNTTPSSYFDTNSWGTAFSTTMTQEVTLEAGKYLLSVMARGNGTTTYQLTAKDQATDISAIGNTGGVFGRGWNSYTVEFEVTEDEAGATIGMNLVTGNSGNWLSFGNFQLVQLSKTDVPMATQQNYDDLTAAINAAETHTLGFDATEYAPYNNVEALEALATAKAFDTSVDNRQKLVVAATTALTNATWTANTAEVDAIFDGQFATTAANTTSGNINLPGWTKVDGIRLLVKDESVDPGLAYTDGKAAVFSWGGTTLTYGEQDGYTLPLNKHSIYKLTFKASAWRDGDAPDWVSVELDGVKQEGATSVSGKINDTEGNPFRTYTYYVEPTADNSILKIYMNHHFTLADLSLKLAVAEPITISEDADFTPANTYANVTLARTIKGGDTWNTFVVPFDITNDELKAIFGDEVAVAEFSENSADANAVEVNFNKMDTPAITANKPVLLKGNAGTSFTFNGKVIKEGDAKVAGTNVDFVGTYAASTAVKAGDYFISANKLYKSEGRTTVKGTRAYIDAKNTTSSVKLFIDDLETAIDAINADTTENSTIYNIAGQRVNKAQKGIYIQNGKKVLVK